MIYRLISAVLLVFSVVSFAEAKVSRLVDETISKRPLVAVYDRFQLYEFIDEITGEGQGGSLVHDVIELFERPMITECQSAPAGELAVGFLGGISDDDAIKLVESLGYRISALAIKSSDRGGPLLVINIGIKSVASYKAAINRLWLASEKIYAVEIDYGIEIVPWKAQEADPFWIYPAVAGGWRLSPIGWIWNPRGRWIYSMESGWNYPINVSRYYPEFAVWLWNSRDGWQYFEARREEILFED